MTARDRILSAIRAALPQERPAPDAIAADASMDPSLRRMARKWLARAPQ